MSRLTVLSLVLLFFGCSDFDAERSVSKTSVVKIDTLQGVDFTSGVRFDTLRITVENVTWPGAGFSFPVILDSSAEDISARILDIVLASFEPRFRRTGNFQADLERFTLDLVDTGTSHGLYSIDFSIESINDRTISLTIGSEGVAAYWEYNTFPVVFDRSDCSRISLPRLLTKEGTRAVGERAELHHVGTIAEHISRLEVESAFDADSADAYRTSQAIAMYQDCIDYWNRAEVADRRYDQMHFTMTQDSLIIIHPRCSNHALRALDELWHVTSGFSLEELNSLLTPYGKELLAE